METLVVNAKITTFSFGILKPRTNSVNNRSFSLLKFKDCKTTPITASYSNPKNPSSRWTDYSSTLKPISVLLPMFRKFKAFTMKASKSKWVSLIHGYNCQQSLGEKFDGQLMQSGAFGTALLSVTATAKVTISPFVATLASNPTFVSGLFAWFVAQSMKVFLNFCLERKWDFRLMVASGGMPSSHSALCTALTTSVAICHGVADSLFPVCLGFSLIVMYDAIGVRRHAGMQAEVLNVIVADLFQGHPISQRKLKELLGHTPSQVIGGALLGIFIAWFFCHVCIAAI